MLFSAGRGDSSDNHKPEWPTGHSGRTVVIVGAGLFGAAAAVELSKRGHTTTVISPNGLDASELAASWDISPLEPAPLLYACVTRALNSSKLVRSVYGGDLEYTSMMEEALPLWKEWNRRWGVNYYHETGLLGLTKDALEENSFLCESLEMLRARNVPTEVMSSADISKRYPQWNTAHYQSAIFTPKSGWVESGKVVDALLRTAHDHGAKIIRGSVAKLILNGQGNRVQALLLEDGSMMEMPTFAQVIVASGAWTRELVPSMKPFIRPTGQVVFHFQLPAHLIPKFSGDRFPGYVADVDTTGFYGFPCLPDGTLKVGNHGPGHAMERLAEGDIDARLESVREAELAKFREFLRRSWPEVAEAPAIYSRMCMYCDTFDGHFIIDWHPTTSNLFVATGGSGHAFKFAPLLGALIADGLERKYNRYGRKFRWREPVPGMKEAARATADGSGGRHDPAFPGAKSAL